MRDRFFVVGAGGITVEYHWWEIADLIDQGRLVPANDLTTQRSDGIHYDLCYYRNPVGY